MDSANPFAVAVEWGREVERRLAQSSRNLSIMSSHPMIDDLDAKRREVADRLTTTREALVVFERLAAAEIRVVSTAQDCDFETFLRALTAELLPEVERIECEQRVSFLVAHGPGCYIDKEDRRIWGDPFDGPFTADVARLIGTAWLAAADEAEGEVGR